MIRTVQIEGAPDTHPERRVPDASDLAEGRLDPSSLKVKAQHTMVFDMMDEGQRGEYEKLYVVLMEDVKAGKATVCANDRSVLSRKDGSTGWFRYLEWLEYDTSGIIGA